MQATRFITAGFSYSISTAKPIYPSRLVIYRKYAAPMSDR